MEITLQTLSNHERIIAIFAITILCLLYAHGWYINRHLRQKIATQKVQESHDILEKMRFLREINHAIRTPLNGVMGFFSIVHTHFEDKLPESFHDYCRMSRESAQTLEKTLGELKDYCDKIDPNIPVQTLRDTATSLKQDPYCL